MAQKLTDEQKRAIFEQTKMENFRASCKLEGLVVPAGPPLTLEELHRKYRMPNEKVKTPTVLWAPSGALHPT